MTYAVVRIGGGHPVRRIGRIQAVTAHMTLHALIELAAVSSERVLTGIGLPRVLVAALHLGAKQRCCCWVIVYVGE